jgi:hypothetical protein
MKILWIVNHGVNYSHLYDTEIFYKKREAIKFFDSICERAARIVRWTDKDIILAW